MYVVLISDIFGFVFRPQIRKFFLSNVFILFLFFFCVGLFFFYALGLLGVSLEAGCLGLFSIGLEFRILLDDLSLLFVFMLFCCGLMALFYCSHYFGGVRGRFGLFCLIILFLFIMCFVVMGGNLLLVLVFWEFLGFVRFLLILYYCNECSLRARVVTLVSSRLGDVGLFVVVCWFLKLLKFSYIFISFCLYFVVCTKRACYPVVS